MPNLEKEWNDLQEAEHSCFTPCEACVNGYKKVPKEKSAIGFNYEVCNCLRLRNELVENSKNIDKANLPERLKTHFKFDKYEFDKLKPEALLSLLEDVEEKNWAYIWGNVGAGKTYSAVLLAKAALLLGRSVYFTGVAQLLDNLRPDATDRTVLKRCQSVDVLVLDDIGQEKPSQWVKERLYLIIDSRWNSLKKTIFTSNVQVEALKKTLGPAVYSRIKGEAVEICLTTLKDKRL